MDISIIIPTYNRLWCLPRAVESCRDDKCKAEIIVVDDGSTDGTWEWLKSQPDIVSLRQENWGKCWAANSAFAIARGRYVRFLDSDDWLCPGANDAQLKLALENGADVVVGGYKVYDADGKLLRRIEWVECDDFIAQQLGECDSSHYSAYLFRREFIKNIPLRQDFTPREDRLLVIEAAMANPKVAVFRQPAICLLHHFRNRLQLPIGMAAVSAHLNHLTIYKKCLGRLAARNELTLRRRKAACRVLWPLAHWIAHTHLDEACEVVEWIYNLDPDFRLPDPGLLGKLYTHLGFRRAEKLLRLRRHLLALFRYDTVSKTPKA